MKINVYLKNRSLIKSLEGKTPYKVLREVKSNISYLKVISSAVYIYNVKIELGDLNKRNKFDPRVRKCRLIKYGKDFN